MSVTAARGFRAAGVCAGLKASGKSDLALVVNDGPLDTAAGVFTTNRVVAAPVVWSRRLLTGQEGGRPGHARAVVLNSGSANACTGEQGLRDTEATAARAAGLLRTEPGQVLVCSTGVIGERIDMPVLLEGIDVAALALADTPRAGTDAATAIMTTDTVSKEDVLTVGTGEKGWTIGGMIKGVGMLAPGLATMLAVITTDAVLTPREAQDALASVTARTVNRINSDGCMSTNDTVLLLASGASGVTPSRAEFDEALTDVMGRLGRRLVADAEGATHDIAITVSGAVSEAAAEAAARTVSSSNLLKCAVAGADPNWGRVLSQLGTVPEDVCPFNPDEVDVTINGVTIFRHGAPDQDRDSVDMSPRETRIDIALSAGQAEATVWTNDLTHGYVTINADYTT
ncbi:bifunctional ornithine acetyltransferase/N-acetylglutamate synthase [Actinomyces naeslundii]|uniref:bifunctional glutamate N-acetyltransferase/amino-acid acetyltransferase ArgJ n=1 Tax=Actinomyces naeslundii TaxID=1655 RepID=UPI00096C123F|nr:bifunctional glutamate N-acetyltransferase/amino-acid acetyltransferase ArgJ [Actinomyces naeslundii]OMG28424.1 bifunctional ornithine acetyltransferase/N-acetylglutamate synthase [Actinomyces naeslundii]